MKPPPPMLPAAGSVTVIANPTATAASIALPPRRMMSEPTLLAISLLVTTIACGANTAGSPARNLQPGGKSDATAGVVPG